MQYRHLDESNVMQDFRANKEAHPQFRDIHYVGYEIRSPGSVLYHHATILADSQDALRSAVASIRLNLYAKFPDLQKLILVYLRSYLSIDAHTIDRATQESMRGQLEGMMHFRRINQFLVYGMRINGKIAHLYSQAGNAIEAFDQLQSSELQGDGELTFLGAYAAHPVSAEYDAHFDYAEARLRMMIADSEEWESYAVN